MFVTMCRGTLRNRSSQQKQVHVSLILRVQPRTKISQSLIFRPEIFQKISACGNIKSIGDFQKMAQHSLIFRPNAGSEIFQKIPACGNIKSIGDFQKMAQHSLIFRPNAGSEIFQKISACGNIKSIGDFQKMAQHSLIFRP